jgi:hypothetical protein
VVTRKMMFLFQFGISSEHHNHGCLDFMFGSFNFGCHTSVRNVNNLV